MREQLVSLNLLPIYNRDILSQNIYNDTVNIEAHS